MSVRPTPLDSLQPGDHVCSIFDSDDQRYSLILDCVLGGLANSQKVVCLLRDASAVEVKLRETDRLAMADATGQLEIRTGEQAFVPDGQFVARRMIAALEREFAQAREAGWAGLRTVADYSWAAAVPSAAVVEELIDYEAELNHLFSAGYGLAVCLYDQRIFDAATLDRVASTHPGTVDQASDSWAPLLRIRRVSNPLGVRLSGEADLSNRGALAAVISTVVNEALTRDESRTIDVTQLRFADGATAHLLVRAAKAAPGRIHLVGCSPMLLQLLEIVSDHTIPATFEVGQE
jgi:anti-anti-sigma regulatory factor